MIRKFDRRVLLLLAGAATVTLAACATGSHLRGGFNLGVDVAFGIDPEAGTYTASAEITDLATGKVVSAPRISGNLGKNAVASSGIRRESGDNYRIRITFWADEISATYELEVIQDGKVVSVSKSSVRH